MTIWMSAKNLGIFGTIRFFDSTHSATKSGRCVELYEWSQALQNTASTLAAELKSQILRELLPKPLVCGGFHNLTIKASISLNVSGDTALEVYAILLQGLADEFPAWEIELEGCLDDLRAKFSR
ncbi:hypothetical protein [Pseudomonas syringae]|uniref:hypothetical protein n=1 Tax=Pseudomonas syringae TaxID=317 RepID=UPI001D0C9230|nr:hypothetical protein [Pseudomonas syringae]